LSHYPAHFRAVVWSIRGSPRRSDTVHEITDLALIVDDQDVTAVVHAGQLRPPLPRFQSGNPSIREIAE
jgi:hypothetical protein